MSNTPLITFYFQVHQPYRLKDLRIMEMEGLDQQYFDDEKNRAIFRKVAEKCYLPANALMLELLNQYPNFRIAYSLSGVFMEQCEEYGPDVLESFKALAATGKVEFLAETYYHSLAVIKSLPEFIEQINMHTKMIQKHFNQTPHVFRNTELIYNNELAHIVRALGFHGIVAEGADHLLMSRSPNEVFVPPAFDLDPAKAEIINKYRKDRKASPSIHLLLKNYRLSDDVAFRFSDKSWIGFPLHADTFTDWLQATGGHSINLFMDYETFGEHQWADTGIFDFVRALPRVWQDRGIHCATPSQNIFYWENRYDHVYDVHNYISWADTERDLSAWQGNRIQKAALDSIYAIENDVKATDDEDLIHRWRKLQTSDHFYYMSTKFWHDGDVHKYFSPYDSPYEAYRRFSHAVWDVRERLKRSSKAQVPSSNGHVKIDGESLTNLLMNWLKQAWFNFTHEF
jgi:alpha-amylase